MIRAILSQSVLSSPILSWSLVLVWHFPDILRNAQHEKFRNLIIYYNQQGCIKIQQCWGFVLQYQNYVPFEISSTFWTMSSWMLNVKGEQILSQFKPFYNCNCAIDPNFVLTLEPEIVINSLIYTTLELKHPPTLFSVWINLVNRKVIWFQGGTHWERELHKQI